MRIPNEINRDNLYRRRRRGGLTTQTYRRLFRLMLALVLVLMVMRQAARPGVYAIFFPETMVAVQAETASHSVQETIAKESRADESSTDGVRSEWETVQAAIADQILSEDQTLEDGERTPTRMEQESLIAQVDDGTVWRAADQPALCATLALHRSSAAWSDEPPFESVLETSLLPLLQQPDVYRGRTVRATGKLVRLVSVQASTNQWGIDRYWDCWLQPEDGSQRPWLVIVPQLPKGIRELVPDLVSDLSSSGSVDVTSPLPTIVVEGEFLKRLSYQSADGAELTPVVVGHVQAVRSNGNAVVGSAIQSTTANGSGVRPVAKKRSLSIGMIVLISTLIGVATGSLVMWRSAVSHRRLRARRQHDNVTLPVLIALTLGFSSLTMNQVWGVAPQVETVDQAEETSSSASDSSLLDILSGFDVERLERLRNRMRTGSNGNAARDEQAKLVFRLKRLSAATLDQRLPEASESPISIGDAIDIEGTIESFQFVAVPDELTEFLGMRQLVELSLVDEAGSPMLVVAAPLPKQVAVGDQLSGVGVSLHDGSEPPAVAIAVAGNLRWRPAQPESLGWQVLSEMDVDITRLPEITALSRRPLMDADSEVFFSIIGAADRAGSMPANEEPLGPIAAAMRAAVVEVSPTDLLKEPEKWMGQWIGIDVETVRWTRVSVELDDRAREVGSDHYYQIDAIGDLGNVQLKIATEDGGVVTMENRYPVTLVAAELPAFLADEKALSRTISKPVRVEGFFYRLWSYESDFMASHGGKQFAPLLIAGRWADRTSASKDPIGVSWIGTFAAVGVVASILAALLYAWFNRRGDRLARQQRA
ncbi:LapA family protein [Rhodopirellula bahusiensis]|nr:LapA family protein [Rhodopirellula bahusiensis]